MIKEKIVNFFIPKNIIENIINFKYPPILKLIIFAQDVSRMLRYYFVYKGSFKGLTNIEKLKEYNISRDSFDGKNKKEGISGYMRLKNSADFLIPTIESCINYFDEIILVENGSTDDTEKKCLFLQEKYKDKIHFYKYEPKVFPLFSKEFKTCPENSVHSFAYMSNFALSKVNYNYALKLDDDQLLLDETLGKVINNFSGGNYFYMTPLLNIQKVKSGYGYASDNFRSTFSGLFGDMGIHPVSPRIFFHSNGTVEGYVHNYFSRYLAISFLHLKLLKPERGFKNYDTNAYKYLENNYKSNGIINLPHKYRYIIEKLYDFK